jgi:heme exporter protein C
MKIEQFVDLRFLLRHPATRVLLPLLSAVAMVAALFVVFLVVPDEREMGAVQRIFYFHVAAATTSYVMIGVLLVGSAFFLLTNNHRWNIFAQAGAGVAFLFCSIVLVSGMIWGHSAWNTWWRWEPRLVSSLVLWLILAAYLLLRSFSAGHPAQSNYLAVLGIVSAVFVPIVIFSIRLLNRSEQAHPQVIARQGLGDPSFKYGLMLSMAALCLYAAWLWIIEMSNRLLAGEYEELMKDIRDVRWESDHGSRI